MYVGGEVMKKKSKPIIAINLEWCKGCGICYSLCPKGVLGKDEWGKVVIKDLDSCTQCRSCEDHCPDYCIKIGG
jgi:2-oxoglutarate ferredoxin oxidoreductase subunit delta